LKAIELSLNGLHNRFISIITGLPNAMIARIILLFNKMRIFYSYTGDILLGGKRNVVEIDKS